MRVHTSDHISLWDASAVKDEFVCPMNEDLNCDVAIVGGGFTGLSTALHACEKGIKCHVFEANQIGFGGSGQNVRLVNAGMWLPPADVEQKLGTVRGRALIQSLGDAPEYVFSLIERFQIRCELTRSGTIHAAHAPKGLDELPRRADTWQALGAPVELLSRVQATEMIGTEAFHGGLLDHRAGTINPMSYVRGLARAANATGAKISTGVHIQNLDRHDGKWTLRTNRGVVNAHAVVLGTNTYTDTPWPRLKQTCIIINYF